VLYIAHPRESNATPAMRTEKRIARTTAVRLTPDGEEPELAVTDNVSTHGARIISQRRFAVDSEVTLVAVGVELRSRARVVYCHPLPDHSFAIGLRLLNPVGSWEVLSAGQMLRA
jgi:hypothetical protein